MPMMRPRSPTSPLRRRDLRPLLSALALGGLLGLAACSKDSPLGFPVPPNADVPEVKGDSYPTIGTTARTGRQPLTEPQRAHLQADLEHLSRDRGASVASTIQKNSAQSPASQGATSQGTTQQGAPQGSTQKAN